MRHMWIISFLIVITSFGAQRWSILSLGTPVKIDFTLCAESFPNNDENFGLASDGVPQGYQEQKAIQFCLT